MERFLNALALPYCGCWLKTFSLAPFNWRVVNLFDKFGLYILKFGKERGFIKEAWHPKERAVKIHSPSLYRQSFFIYLSVKTQTMPQYKFGGWGGHIALYIKKLCCSALGAMLLQPTRVVLKKILYMQSKCCRLQQHGHFCLNVIPPFPRSLDFCMHWGA